jgi:outer membrane protein assembly factor BamB
MNKPTMMMLSTAAFMGWASSAFPATVVAKPATAPPTTTIDVKGSQYAPKETIDVYFDKQVIQAVTANKKGSFNDSKFTVPASAAPGAHSISAVGLKSGYYGQTGFTVRTDWTEFRFSPVKDGANPYENVLSAANVSGLGTAWIGIVPGGTYSSPAIVGGIAYIGSYNGGLYAFDATTGAPQWVASTSGPVYASPAVASGQIFLGDINGNFYAFNAVSGRREWRLSIGQGYIFYSSAAVANGMVYAAASATGSGSGVVYAFDARFGTIRWQTATGPMYGSSPAVWGNSLYVGGGDGNLYSYNASTGAPNWTARVLSGNSIDTAPAVYSNIVYVTSYGGDIDAFDASTGALIWGASSTDASIVSSPAVANGVLYVAPQDQLLAFNAANGYPLWNIPTTHTLSYSSPAVANGVLYIGTEDYGLQAYSTDDGSLLWSGGPCSGSYMTSSPSIANGMVYQGCDSGNLYALALGHHLARTPPPPAVDGLVPQRNLKPPH